jgi:hypothetical protein
MDSEINAWYNKFIANGRGVVLGEWGTINKNNTPAQVTYADYFVRAAKSRQMVPVVWDDGGNMGNLNRSNNTWRYPTIVDAIINAYGGGGGCTPTTITPYVQINNGTWTQTASASVSAGASVRFGPQPASGGSWSWTGPNGYTASTREILLSNVQTSQAGTYVARYTNPSGCASTQNFTLTVSGGGGQIIANGTYRISPRHAPAQALDVNGNGTADGSDVIQWTYSGANNQRWTLTHLGSNVYQIIGVASGKALAVATTSTANGVNVDIRTYTGATNHRWTISATTGGYYRLTPVSSSGSALDVSGASTANGANVQQWSYGGANNQQWIFQTP